MQRQRDGLARLTIHYFHFASCSGEPASLPHRASLRTKVTKVGCCCCNGSGGVEEAAVSFASNRFLVLVLSTSSRRTYRFRALFYHDLRIIFVFCTKRDRVVAFDLIQFINNLKKEGFSTIWS